MKSACVSFMGLLCLLAASMVQAGTVYYWTDENGVRHFSNTGPPENAKDVGTVAETRSDPTVEAVEEQSTGNEPGQALPTPQPGQEDASPTFRERFEEAEQERIARRAEDERRRLQAEIELVEQRSLSRTFTEGMREAQLDPLRQQLGLLNSDPARYFRMKQEGAFTQGGQTGAMRQDLQQ